MLKIRQLWYREKEKMEFGIAVQKGANEVHTCSDCSYVGNLVKFGKQKSEKQVFQDNSKG